jgi:hypothetical protein
MISSTIQGFNLDTQTKSAYVSSDEAALWGVIKINLKPKLMGDPVTWQNFRIDS